MRSLFLTVLFSLVFVPQVYSQKVIHYRLTMFGGGSNVTYVNRPGGGTEVRAIRGYVADPIKATLREDQYLDFFEASRKQEGEEPMKPDFTVMVPNAAGSDLLIILLQSGQEVSSRLLDFKTLRMGDGDQMLFNTLPVPIALAYSDGDGKKWGKPILVKPNSQARIPAPNDISVSRRVAAQNSKTQEFIAFSKGVYLKPVGGREVVFCYMEKGNPLPTLETVLIHNVKIPQSDAPRSQ